MINAPFVCWHACYVSLCIVTYIPGKCSKGILQYRDRSRRVFARPRVVGLDSTFPNRHQELPCRARTHRLS
jgi:hypothetical protein